MIVGNVIIFPIERRKPHVVLLWDCAWDEYRVEAVGCVAPAGRPEWSNDYGEAVDLLISKGERLGLPMIDCTMDGRIQA